MAWQYVNYFFFFNSSASPINLTLSNEQSLSLMKVKLFSYPTEEGGSIPILIDSINIQRRTSKQIKTEGQTAFWNSFLI